MTKEQKIHFVVTMLVYACFGALLFWVSPILGGAAIFAALAGFAIRLRFVAEAVALVNISGGLTTEAVKAALENLRLLNNEAISRTFTDVDPPTQTKQ